MMDPNILIYGLGAVAGGGLLATAVSSALALDWRGKARRARAEAKEARLEAYLDQEAKIRWQSLYETTAREVVDLTGQLRTAQGFSEPEPKLVRIPKGQPGAGRFIPNPKLKAQLTA